MRWMFRKSDVALADRLRFLPIPDVRAWYPGLGFSGRPLLVTQGEPVLVTDPISLADIYNTNDDPVAAHVRRAGVIVNDFGGDVSCAVWWKDPFLVLPTHIDGSAAPPRGAIVLADEVGCDSASFVFLPIRSDMPPVLTAKVREVLNQRCGAMLNLPPGEYTFWLEQFENTRQPNMDGVHRNIVAERKALSSRSAL
jgi:hypothetical protein